MDPRWLQEWAGELSAGVPDFRLLDEPVQVDSQEPAGLAADEPGGGARLRPAAAG